MGLDIKWIPEYKNTASGDWLFFNVPEDHPIKSRMSNRDYQVFSLLGPKWKDEYKDYPTLPLLRDLPVQTLDRFESNTFKHKYTSFSMTDVYRNIELYDCSEEFALHYNPMNSMFNSTIYIDEALAFDYNQLAVNDLTWNDLLKDWWIPIMEYFKSVGVSQVHISFGH